VVLVWIHTFMLALRVVQVQQADQYEEISKFCVPASKFSGPQLSFQKAFLLRGTINKEWHQITFTQI